MRGGDVQRPLRLLADVAYVAALPDRSRQSVMARRPPISDGSTAAAAVMDMPAAAGPLHVSIETVRDASATACV